MPAHDVQLKRIPRVRVAEVTGTAASFEPKSIGPVIQPLYGELCGALDRAGLTPAGPGIAYYEDLPEGDGVLVHAALPVNADLGRDHHGFSILDLPEIEQAATIVHRGSMDDVMPTIQTLARWIDANGYRSAGYNRELYIECGEDRETWVTELQEPVASDSGRAQVADHSSTETDRPQNVHECRPTSTGLGTTHAAPVGSTLRVGTRGPELEGTKGAAGARWNDDDHLMQTLWTMPAEHWFPSAVEIESRSAHTSASTRGRPLVHRGRSSTECA